MPLIIVRNDITKMPVDAIVNSTDPSLQASGGLDALIRRAGGARLSAECERLGTCAVGEAKITVGGDLPCKYVIHTVGPQWFGGGCGERDALISCYRSALALAQRRNCETVAFPLISSGIYGYPKDQALRIAMDTIGNFLLQNDMTVYLVVFDAESYRISGKLFSEISAYIDDNYVGLAAYSDGEELRRSFPAPRSPQCIAPTAPYAPRQRAASFDTASTLDDMLKVIDESFSEMLLRKIDEAGMTDVECYKKANIDRKLFSKIRSDRLYKPSKPTAIAFAIALGLSLDETKELLMKAGFALSHSNKFDIIIEFFIRNGNYNIFEINEALFAFDQNLLGA